MDSRPRYWINSVSLDQVLLGVEGGFTQADHGRETRLRRLRRGDSIAFYSPRRSPGSSKPFQRFTALGVVADDQPYRIALQPKLGSAQGPGLHPWRRRVDFEPVADVPVGPLLPVLGFVDDEEHWGLPFRRGLFEVPATDFSAIAGAMRDAADPGAWVIGGRTEVPAPSSRSPT